MATFSVAVDCISGSEPHKHTIVVEPGQSGVYGAGPPPTVRLQYTCPVTGKALIASFKPPVDASRPFKIVEVV